MYPAIMSRDLHMNSLLAKVLIVTHLVMTTLVDCGPEVRRSIDARVRNWLHNRDQQIGLLANRYVTASWAYNTNITEHNKNNLIKLRTEVAGVTRMYIQEALEFDQDTLDDPDVRRSLKLIIHDGGSFLTDDDEVTRFQQVRSEMEGLHGKAKVCHKPGDTDPNKCYAYSGELSLLMQTSRDWDELQWAWQGFRDGVGPSVKHLFTEYVHYLRKATVTTTGSTDAGAAWRATYEMDIDYSIRDDVQRLWKQIRPLYQQVHAYARRKLRNFYPAHAREFVPSGHLPVHILGGMWSAGWSSLMGDILGPYGNVTKVDVTKALKEQNYTAVQMFRLSESFFTSMGMPPMPNTFWRRSMFTKPPDRHAVCHGSAWDFHDGQDFRIKMCTTIDTTSLIVVHHEMGHIQYFMAVSNLSDVHKTSANPGFHEAIGDAVALSVYTPEHLYKVGLLSELSHSHEATINSLMRQALDRVVHLPLALSIDLWRWDVLDGTTPPSEYNRHWWETRCRLQGIYPPVPREDKDFDPGTVYHVTNNTPYIRYFVATILQFQFYKSLCAEAGHKGALHNCDIYNSTKAGDKFWKMMSLGRSRPWPEALQAVTGARRMDAAPLMEYFAPLLKWLKHQNRGQKVGWDESACPHSYASAAWRVQHHTWRATVALAITLVIMLRSIH